MGANLLQSVVFVMLELVQISAKLPLPLEGGTGPGEEALSVVVGCGRLDAEGVRVCVCVSVHWRITRVDRVSQWSVRRDRRLTRSHAQTWQASQFDNLKKKVTFPLFIPFVS